MLAAVKTVGTENNSRSLSDFVGAFEQGHTFVIIFGFFSHSVNPPKFANFTNIIIPHIESKSSAGTSYGMVFWLLFDIFNKKAKHFRAWLKKLKYNALFLSVFVYGMFFNANDIIKV